MYVSSNDKLMEDQDQQGQQGQQGQQMLGGGAESPTNISGSSSSAVAPGSAGTGGTAGGAAWTNIQAYLKANPQSSPIVTGFEDKATDFANQERDNFSQFKDSRQQYEDTKNTYNQVKDVNSANLSNYLTSQMSGKPTNANDTVSNLSNFLQTDFNNIGFSPYQQSEGFDELKGIAETREGFQDYVNQQYDQAAGRPLTSGQRALQNQLDLSRGAFSDVREAALQQLSGLEPIRNEADQLMSTYADDQTNINNWKSLANQLQNDFKSSDDLYTRKYGEGRWDPIAQQQGEQAFFNNAINPLRSELERVYAQIAESEGVSGGAEGVLGYRPDLRESYDGLMSGDWKSPDQIKQWIHDQQYTLRPGAPNASNSPMANLDDVYNAWATKNNDLIQETFY